MLLVSSTLHASLIPFAVQPSESTVNPGLAVTYYWGLNNIIDNLLQRIEHSIGKAGTTLPNLDYKSGHGTVLTSGRHAAVGAPTVDGCVGSRWRALRVWRLPLR